MQEKENILKILEGTKTSIQKGDVVTIKNLSNQTTNTAALTHDPDNIAIAVIVYTISKLFERQDYQKLPGWQEFYNTIFKCIDNSIISIKNNDDAQIKTNLDCLRTSLVKVSGNLKKHIQDVFRKASINKASKIYEHGISMEKTAKLLGITMFELASYSGQREQVSETPIIKGVDVKSRINLAMEMFK
ncbi:hypothetical protein KAI04_03295 [Candidatus Pacearchaeota archaeon]|nr:hypothetical protein [Candidatus Pacearchaeota archaeon]